MFDDVHGAVTRAKSRLDYLQGDPLRNATHAIRVLVKFKLLEAQALRRDALFAWMQATPLMQRVHARFMNAHALETIFDQTLQALAKAAALSFDGDRVIDRN